MSKWISSAYIKLLMERNRLLQGNSEYELWKQTVGKVIDAMPSIEIVRCKECKWFGHIGCAIQIVDDSDKPSENDFCSFGEVRDE